MYPVSRLLIVALPVFFVWSASFAGALQDIKKRGAIIVGVKADYQPWGFRDEQGNLTGMEIELARDIARQLKVKLELVPVQSAARVASVNEHKVDVILATFGVTEERKKQVIFVQPNYYASMEAVLTRTGSGIRGEASLKGRKICSVAGNYANKDLSKFAGSSIAEYKSVTESLDKLLAGECEGFGYDDVVLLYQIKSEAEKWKDYDLTSLLGVPPVPWGLAIALDEKDGMLAQRLSEIVKNWHRRGTLLALEKKWVGANSMALQWLSEKVKSADTKAKAAKEARELAGGKPKDRPGR
jgi:polar amino acid transport system substrate-binding protein